MMAKPKIAAKKVGSVAIGASWPPLLKDFIEKRRFVLDCKCEVLVRVGFEPKGCIEHSSRSDGTAN